MELISFQVAEVKIGGESRSLSIMDTLCNKRPRKFRWMVDAIFCAMRA